MSWAASSSIVRSGHVEYSRQYRLGRSPQVDRLLAQAAVVSAIAVLWFCPLLLFWFAVWNDGQTAFDGRLHLVA